MRTAGAPARIVLEADRTILKRLDPQDTPDLAYVTVKIVDRDGNLCPDAANLVRFACTGAASFKCVANGDSTCLESFVEPQMQAFLGQLVGTVAAGADAGEATLMVTVEGLEPRTVALSVR